MAAIDKLNEFYLRLPRFIFLSENFLPDDFPHQIDGAFKTICEFYHKNLDLQKECDERIKKDDEWQDKYSLNRKKELIKYLVDECF